GAVHQTCDHRGKSSLPPGRNNVYMSTNTFAESGEEAVNPGSSHVICRLHTTSHLGRDDPGLFRHPDIRCTCSDHRDLHLPGFCGATSRDDCHGRLFVKSQGKAAVLADINRSLDVVRRQPGEDDPPGSGSHIPCDLSHL